MKRLFSKMGIITFTLILILISLLLYYKENTTNIEAPKRATLVYVNDIYD